MKKFLVTALGAVGLIVLAPAQAAPNDHANPAASVVHSAPVCPGPASAGSAHCHALVVTDANGVPIATGLARSNTKGGNGGKGGNKPGGNGGGSTVPPWPGYYGPMEFQTAYGVTSAAGQATSVTVAIVDAYDNPTVVADLQAYIDSYNTAFPTHKIPSFTCDALGPCFTKVNQSGGNRLPRADSGWALEIALDVQAVHAVCPHCNILLVEANSNSLSNLLTAEAYAAANADVVSNSWGASEFSSETTYDSSIGYKHSSDLKASVPTTVSSGDSGYGVEWPAASPNVTAVGGTTLKLTGYTRSSEKVWSGSGSGCSKYEPKPNFQQTTIVSGNTSCVARVVADVAADADPTTGAAVYDSYGYMGQKGWFKVGGTSLAAPIIAAIYALAPNGGTQGATSVYAAYAVDPANLYDVTTGSNGSCSDTYLCNATSGYDGPTGLGTPNGAGAF